MAEKRVDFACQSGHIIIEFAGYLAGKAFFSFVEKSCYLTNMDPFEILAGGQ